MAGLKTHVLITDMNEVLGRTAGNALEIDEALCFLRDEDRERRLNEVTLGLCAEMLLATNVESSRDVAMQRCDEAVTSGRALEIFGKMVAALGGPSDFIENSSKYFAEAPVVRSVHAKGFLTAIDIRGVGNAIIELGGGRRALEDKLDLSVGLTNVAPIGSTVDKERPLAVIQASSDDTAQTAAAMIRDAYEISASPPAERPIIYNIFAAD